jgi:hypothetical protein
MAAEYLAAAAMRRVVTRAIREFAKRDTDLLHVDVQEETLAHRLAIYIERRIKGWHVDCEYNRNLRAPKMRLDGANRMRPDIIAHIRNSARNLLAVEIKKSAHNKFRKAEARQRVLEFTGKWTTYPRYCHGVVLIFPVRPQDPKEVHCEWFHRDGCDALFGGEPRTGTMAVSLIVKRQSCPIG